MRATTFWIGLLFTLEAAAFVRPRHPNAGDAVSIAIPHDAGSGCSVVASVSRSEARGRTVFTARAAPSGLCEAYFRAGTHWHAVGRLKAGRYVVVTRDGRRSFTVTPKPEPVEPKPATLLPVKREILKVVTPGTCGIGADPDKAIARAKRKYRRLWKAAKRYWPRAEDEQVYQRVMQLRRIRLEWVKRARYRYRVKDGCDKPRMLTGFVTIAPTIRVEPPVQKARK